MRRLRPVFRPQSPDLAADLVRIDPSHRRRARAGRLDPRGAAGGPGRPGDRARHRPALLLALPGDAFDADVRLLDVGQLAVRLPVRRLAPERRAALGVRLPRSLALSVGAFLSIGYSSLRGAP